MNHCKEDLLLELKSDPGVLQYMKSIYASLQSREGFISRNHLEEVLPPLVHI